MHTAAAADAVLARQHAMSLYMLGGRASLHPTLLHPRPGPLSMLFLMPWLNHCMPHSRGILLLFSDRCPCHSCLLVAGWQQWTWRCAT
jgi:hypothetical protein